MTELVVPEVPQGRIRKCSIVQEEEDDEEEYRSQELTPGHANFSRRGSRSEGKLNVAIQVLSDIWLLNKPRNGVRES